MRPKIDFLADKPTAVSDTECYQNYWAIGFRDVASGRVRVFEKYDGVELDKPRIAKVMRTWRIVTFNGHNYDIPMLMLAMSDATNGELKRASDDIILGDLRPWEFYEKYQCALPPFPLDHIDWMEVSPGSPTKPSLKIYAGRLHSKRMQDLPFEPDQWITEEDRVVLVDYLHNDLQVTQDGYTELKGQIHLRAQMSAEYGVDLRSKSDAQVSEAVVKAELQRIVGDRVERPDIEPGQFFYKPPEFVRFESTYMQETLERIRKAPFLIDRAGIVHMPEALENLGITLGQGVYRMGIGGLHSSETKQTFVSDDKHVVVSPDVGSYYPSLILGSGMKPKHLSIEVLNIYRKIYVRRLAAKKAKQKDIAETLKIALNGFFGKTGSPFSILYSPDLMIQTTVSGQLALLMLIERLEAQGFRVISANTDGIAVHVERARREIYNCVVMEWEWDTKLSLEETEYKGIYSRDVNSYFGIAVDPKTGKEEVKRKGSAYAAAGRGLPGAFGMKKNPYMEVATDAAIAFLQHNIPVEQTINLCFDIRKFVCIRTVKGGGEKDGQYLGKAVRWYYSKGMKGAITYCDSGNNVPRTEGAMPCQELPEECPDDIDYDYYVREAYAILDEVGAGGMDPALVGRTGTTVARLEDQKTFHIVELPGGVSRCGRRPASIRDRWIEVSDVPVGHKLCGACRKADAL